MVTATTVRQYYLTLISIVLSILLLANSLPYWLKKNTPTPPTTSYQPKNNLKASPKEPLSNYPLFGQAAESIQVGISDTPLNLKLIGILEASDIKESQAWISIEDAKEKLYFVNDKINENTVLWRVLKNAVLLKRNGKIEKLSLPKLPLNMKQAPSSKIIIHEDTF